MSACPTNPESRSFRQLGKARPDEYRDRRKVRSPCSFSSQEMSSLRPMPKDRFSAVRTWSISVMALIVARYPASPSDPRLPLARVQRCRTSRNGPSSRSDVGASGECRANIVLCEPSHLNSSASVSSSRFYFTRIIGNGDSEGFTVKQVVKSIAAIVMAFLTLSAASAHPACNQNQVYSSSLGQCIPKAAMCSNNQVYSSSMHQCIPKAAMCSNNQVYSSSMHECIPKAAMCSGNQVYSSSLHQCIPKGA